MGWRWVAFRAAYTLRKKSGALKRATPPIEIGKLNLADIVTPGTPTKSDEFVEHFESSAGRFLFPPGVPPSKPLLSEIARADGVRRTLAVADDFRAGRFLYYSRKVVDHGRPVDWLRVPIAGGGRHHANTHWTDYPTFSPELGDVKTVWEPSRFACAFWLARAFVLSDNEQCAECFWELFESWVKQNPPSMGPNWKCGQESSLRAFAWIFALQTFWNAPSTTGERIKLMVKMLALTGRRVAANIDYAISQKNNHGISEAAGLFTIGLLLPFLRESDAWHERGRRLLEQEVARQIYDDGSFVQHSMNYHRLMLSDCLWVMRLAELNGRPLSKAFASRVHRAGEFIYNMLDPATGRVPNYGGNDGALILPLDACDYTDYRPIAQAAMFAASGSRPLSAGPWDELGAWLFGDAFLQARHIPRELASQRMDVGGYYTLRGERAWCMIRCHSYKDRPAHVDMMHVDLWHEGRSILSDSGTYLYYCPGEPAFEKYFKDVGAHNTIQIGDKGPLRLASRFMWVPWPEAQCEAHTATRWQGVSLAYSRAPWGVTHRRSVERISDDEWLITDELTGPGEQAVTLRWHTLDAPFALADDDRAVLLHDSTGLIRFDFEMPDSISLTVHRGEGDEGGEVAGWESLYYGERTPRPTLILNGRATLPMKITTRIRMGDAAPL